MRPRKTRRPGAGGRAFEDADLPPLVLPSADAVRRLRAQVDADERVKAAFGRDVLGRADAAVGRQLRPLERIIYEGRVSGDPQRVRSIEHLHDMYDLRALTWAAVVGDDPRHARAAIDWTTAWARALPPSGNDVNDNKLDSILLAT